MDRWLTLSDASQEFRLSPRGVLNLVKSGQLVAVRLTKRSKRTGAIRILYPGPRLAPLIAESESRIERIPLLSGHDVAEVLSVKPATVRQLKKRGHLHGYKAGNAIFYPAAEIRRYLREKERNKSAGKRLYSPILADWLRRLIEGDAEIDVQVLDTLLRQAVGLSEPLKSMYITKVWDHFDAINSLVQLAKNTGEGIVSDAPAAFVPHHPPKIQLKNAAAVIEFFRETQSRE